MQYIRDTWAKSSFFEHYSLPEELNSRGFDEDFDAPTYLYRTDALKLWKAIGDFTSDFVDEIYQSDAQVAADADLQEWAFETSAPTMGAVPGFPAKFNDKATLVKTMQTIWWIASGLHGAINCPQYDVSLSSFLVQSLSCLCFFVSWGLTRHDFVQYLSFAPNRPLHLRKTLKMCIDEAGDDPDWFFREACGDQMIYKLNIISARMLTLPSETTLTSLSHHYDKAQYGKASYAKFLEVLEELGDEIEARNKYNRDAGRPVYAYLHPSTVPASVDV